MDQNLGIIFAVVASTLALVLVIVGFVLHAKRSKRGELPWEAPDAGAVLDSDTTVVREGETVEYSQISTPARADASFTGDTESVAEGHEIPESVPSRMQRLRARLARSGGLGRALLGILSRGDLSAADWEELEDTLLMADVGLESTSQIMNRLRDEAKIRATNDPGVIRSVLREELLRLVDPSMDRSLSLPFKADSDIVPAEPAVPAVILMVGVNGTGKTTTAGKLARLLVAEDRRVLLGAADTFRAAAADQLETWGERVGVPVVRSEREGADPASVAFEAVSAAEKAGTHVVIVDTAGRLQNKAGLMDELGKIKRVIEKKAPVREVLLVLDATTGQNGMQQAKVFADVTGLTGIVLTKLDGTAKGGIVMSVQRELGVPVKFVGLGEGADDLAPFDPEAFVDSLLS